MRAFTVEVIGEVEDDSGEFASAEDFAEYLLGEVRYRIENETPDGVTVRWRKGVARP